MKPTIAPWNLNNHNVLILAGKHYEEFALKYGLCIIDNEYELIPCKYLSIYENDTIKYLFEITKNPMDNIEIDNSKELSNVLDSEKERFEYWMAGKQKCRLFVLKKISVIGPVVNDYISPIKGKLTPFTCGSPRYTTYERLISAKLTSELKCQFDDDCPEEVPPPPPPPPIIEKKKKNYTIPIIVGSLIVLIAVLSFTLLLRKPEKIVETKIVKEESGPPKILLPNLYFQIGKSELEIKHIKKLEEIWIEIKDPLEKYTELRLIITGFADSRGNTESNLDLSLKRAKTIENWFVSKGLDIERILSYGKGEVPVKNAKELEKNEDYNRRVEFEIKQM